QAEDGIRDLIVTGVQTCALPISEEAKDPQMILDPLQRIAEDHLRILRFFRFHARFDAGEPDAAALDACTARANDLMALSRERIADRKSVGVGKGGRTRSEAVR